jgi:coenzyme F420-reducing hydrogenase delta subunit
MDNGFKPKVTIFHCHNGIDEAGLFPLTTGEDVEVRLVGLPCSSLAEPVHLLKAFEAGADGVVVLACPEGECRYVDGNVRARKRVERVRKILDEIELDGRRLSFFNVTAGDEAATQVLARVKADLVALGPNPAVLVPQ